MLRTKPAWRAVQQVSGRDHPRLQQRRLAGPFRFERYAAQQAVSEQSNGTFTEEGMAAGVAFGEDGVSRGAMGVDSGRLRSLGQAASAGREFLQPDAGSLSQRRNGLVRRRSAQSPSVGRASLLTLTFGVFFFDYDLDGYPDIFAANGHIEEEIDRVQPKVQLSANRRCSSTISGSVSFENVTACMGAEFNRPIVARGAAYADYDHDGDLDVLISTNDGPAYLFRNDGGNRNHWLNVRLVGTKSNRDAIGAVVRDRKRFREAVEYGAQRLQLLLAKRPGADLWRRSRHKDFQAPSRVAKRFETTAYGHFC